ncbi:unnamed protein product [Toxocara canis]|uniref:HOOK domain-containing protein n=1 Tax=Toxocara canis TaxID=6265 RepID=A0A183V992_TOXCA|nr:unnamed protein product [Toxocara canis]
MQYDTSARTSVTSDRKNDNASAEAESKQAELRRHLRDRDRTIRELEEELRAKDAIIADKCHLIECLEQWYPESFAADVASLGNTSELTIQYVDSNEMQTTSVGDARRMLEQYEEEHRMRLKLTEQNEQLLSQWDAALEYVEQVQKQLQEEMRRTNALRDENASLRKRIRETVIISKGGIQFIAVFFILFSFYLYHC